MPRRLAVAACLAFCLSATLCAQVAATDAPQPSPAPTPDAQAERIFARARTAWRTRGDVPFVRYGALVRYLHKGHVFDNWWDAYYRSDDGALSLEPLHDIAEEKRRLGGVPFSIFGLVIFDTNPDAEPIRLDDPLIAPISSFGILTRGEISANRPDLGEATPTPAPNPSALPTPNDGSAASPQPSYREIGHVQANIRAYQINFVGRELVAGSPALHLTLTPLRDPEINRLRDIWVEPATYRTVQLNVAGLLGSQPYDAIEWTVHYVLIDGRNYVQQIVADAPLHFGIETTLPKFEFDFVDYHFPKDVPPLTFNHSLLGTSRS